MDYTFVLQPATYTPFGDEAEQIDTCKEWGLLSEKAAKMKAFHYKRSGHSVPCTIVGYVDRMTAVIELDNGRLHCIHPSYLKEMQAASYGVKSSFADNADTPSIAGVDEASAAPAADSATASAADSATASAAGSAAEPATTSIASPADESAAKPAAKPDAKAAPSAAQAPAKKGKKEKLQLPEEKVSMTATVQSFTTVPNHFSDTDDEVIVYDAVSIVEPAIELGVAWSSHSATLKKLELEVGDTIAFEAKVAAKKLTKHPVPYKINNPSKIRKL